MPQPIDPSPHRPPESQRPAVPCQSGTRPMIHTQPSVSVISACLRPVSTSINGTSDARRGVEWELYARTHSRLRLDCWPRHTVRSLHSPCPPAISGSVQSKTPLSSCRRSLAHSHPWRSLCFLESTFRFLQLHYCAKASHADRHCHNFRAPSSGFHFDDASIPLIYLLLFLRASAATFSWAARSSFFPTLVDRDAFANAVTWNNSVF